MLRDLMFESFRWCTRDELEYIEMSSRVLHKTIMAVSGVLPLRTLERVDMGYSLGDKFQIEVIEDAYRPVGYFRASLHEGDFEAILRRLKHTFIKKFYINLADSAFLRHFMENAQRLNIVMERIKFNIPYTPPTDAHALADSIVKLLRPQAYDGLTSSPTSDTKGAK